MDADRLKQLGDRAQDLDKLKDHPSWQVLREVCDGKTERLAKVVVAGLVAGEAVDQRKLDYLRGWVDGIEYLLAVPERAADSLNAALKKAERLKEVASLERS